MFVSIIISFLPFVIGDGGGWNRGRECVEDGMDAQWFLVSEMCEISLIKDTHLNMNFRFWVRNKCVQFCFYSQLSKKKWGLDEFLNSA